MFTCSFSGVSTLTAGCSVGCSIVSTGAAAAFSSTAGCSCNASAAPSDNVCSEYDGTTISFVPSLNCSNSPSAAYTTLESPSTSAPPIATPAATAPLNSVFAFLLFTFFFLLMFLPNPFFANTRMQSVRRPGWRSTLSTLAPIALRPAVSNGLLIESAAGLT